MPSPWRSRRAADAAVTVRPRRSNRARPLVESLEAILLLSSTPNDFFGDGKSDYVVFDKSTATFEVSEPGNPANVMNVQIGNPAHNLVPVAGDYSGQGRFDFAVYDKTTATFYVKFSSNPNALAETTQLGAPAHGANIIPVPGDYNGDGKVDFAIYDQSVATYYVRDSTNTSGPLLVTCQIGDPSHGASLIPLPGVYQGTTSDDFAIYDKLSATYFVKYASNPSVLAATSQVGDPSHAASIIPVPADYDGNGRFDFAIYDKSVATFYVKYDGAPNVLAEASQLGAPSDASSISPLPGDFDSDVKSDFAIYDKSVASFYVRYATNLTTLGAVVQNGAPSHAGFLDPIVSDVDGDHLLDYTVFDQGTGTFYTKLGASPTMAGPSAAFANTSHINVPVPEPVT